MLFDPKARPTVAVTAATDDTGQSLVPTAAMAAQVQQVHRADAPAVIPTPATSRRSKTRPQNLSGRFVTRFA